MKKQKRMEQFETKSGTKSQENAYFWYGHSR